MRTDFCKLVDETIKTVVANMGTVAFPSVIYIENPTTTAVPPNGYVLSVYDVPVARGEVVPERLYVDATAAELLAKGISATPYRFPWRREDSASIPADLEKQAVAAGYKLNTPEKVIGEHVRIALRRHSADLFGVQEASVVVNRLRADRSDLIEAVIPRAFTLQEVSDVLWRLLREEVPIIDLRLVLESLSRWKNKQKDPWAVVEHVRRDMRGAICRRFASGNILAFYALHPELQEIVERWLIQSPGDQPIGLPPAERMRLYSAVERTILPRQHRYFEPVVVVPPAIRRGVRSAFAEKYPEIAVLSTEEVIPQYAARYLNTIMERPVEPEAGPRSTVDAGVSG